MTATMSPDTTAWPRLTRGRRTALALGIPLCLLLVAFTGLNLVGVFGQGSYEVSDHLPAKTQSVTVSVPAGNVNVEGGYRSASVFGLARYTLVRPAVTEDSGPQGAAVGYRCAIPVGECGLDATVLAPASLLVTVATGRGNVVVTGSASPLTLTTRHGSLSLSGVSNFLMLNTGDGNIQADQVLSTVVNAIAVHGSVALGFLRAPQDISISAGGDITLVVPRGPAQYRVIARTGRGTVSVTVPRTYEPSALNVIDVRSDQGNITIREQ